MKKNEKKLQAEFKVYENTWSKQRAKRRRKQINLKIDIKQLDDSTENSNDSVCSKKSIDSKSDINQGLEVLLNFEVQIKFKANSNNEIIILELNSNEMVSSHVREYSNQILQFVKNNLFK